MSSTMEQHALAAGKAFPWHELYVPNLEQAINFYTNALGLGTESMDMGPMGTYHMLTHNGSAVAGMMSTDQLPMQGVPPHWAVYLSVDDVDARLAKCKEHGATIVVEPIDVPNVGRMALISDPQGAHIWLYKEASQG